MRFMIKRTSGRNNSGPPCDEAIPIAEDMWAIDINTIEDLISFINKYGEIVVGPIEYPIGLFRTESSGGIVVTKYLGDLKENYFIEIYDDYRE